MKNYYKGKRIAEDIIDQNYSEEVQQWMHDNKYAAQVLETITDGKTLEERLDEFNTEVDTLQVNRLKNRINDMKRRRNKIMRLSISMAATAVLLFSFFLFYDTVKIPESKIVNEKTKVEFVRPTLVLESGNSIDLISVGENIKIAENQSVCCNNDTLKYTNINADKMQYNTLIIPRKFMYTAKLEDGTEVCLNANSELKYPIKFNREVREVFLKGEGFFNVAKSDKPFIVRGEFGSVRVYGTKFNLKMRGNNSMEAVLAEGAVGIWANGMEEKEVRMKPNQLAVVNTVTGECQVENTDVEKYTIWMSNYFKFDGENLPAIFENLSNWYGVEIHYNKADMVNVGELFIGLFNRNTDLDEIFEVLELTSKISVLKKDNNYFINLK